MYRSNKTQLSRHSENYRLSQSPFKFFFWPRLRRSLGRFATSFARYHSLSFTRGRPAASLWKLLNALTLTWNLKPNKWRKTENGEQTLRSELNYIMYWPAKKIAAVTFENVCHSKRNVKCSVLKCVGIQCLSQLFVLHSFV